MFLLFFWRAVGFFWCSSVGFQCYTVVCSSEILALPAVNGVLFSCANMSAVRGRLVLILPQYSAAKRSFSCSTNLASECLFCFRLVMFECFSVGPRRLFFDCYESFAALRCGCGAIWWVDGCAIHYISSSIVGGYEVYKWLDMVLLCCFCWTNTSTIRARKRSYW